MNEPHTTGAATTTEPVLHHDAATTAAEEVPRGAVAVIVNKAGQHLMHLRDDIPHIAWPGYWSVLGGGCDPGENPHDAIVRELDEEAGLYAGDLQELFEVRDTLGSGQLLTVFSGTWNGDESALPLTEGQKLQFFDPDALADLPIPPHIRTVLQRYQAAAGADRSAR